jgi:hypothetical protein
MSRGYVADLARHGQTRLQIMESLSAALMQRKDLTPLARIQVFLAAIKDCPRKGIPDQMEENVHMQAGRF